MLQPRFDEGAAVRRLLIWVGSLGRSPVIWSVGEHAAEWDSAKSLGYETLTKDNHVAPAGTYVATGLWHQ